MLRPFEDAWLDHAACLDYLAGQYTFDLLPNTPSLLSFDQAAMVLEITTPTLARLVSLGEIPALDFPGEGQFVLKSDLIKYIHLALFHNKPVLGTEISPNSPIKNAPDYPK